MKWEAIARPNRLARDGLATPNRPKLPMISPPKSVPDSTMARKINTFGVVPKLEESSFDQIVKMRQQLTIKDRAPGFAVARELVLAKTMGIGNHEHHPCLHL